MKNSDLAKTQVLDNQFSAFEINY